MCEREREREHNLVNEREINYMAMEVEYYRTTHRQGRFELAVGILDTGLRQEICCKHFVICLENVWKVQKDAKDTCNYH